MALSGVDILGIVAGVFQVADIGAKLSVNPSSFARKAKSADLAIRDISKDVSLTCSVLRELAKELQKDEKAKLCSNHAMTTAQRIIDECRKVFNDLNTTLDKNKPMPQDTMALKKWAQRLKYPFVEPHIDLLRANLERLKSTILLMLNVIMYAGQLRRKASSSDILQDQRELIKSLKDEMKTNNEKVTALSQHIECFSVSDPNEQDPIETHQLNVMNAGSEFNLASSPSDTAGDPAEHHTDGMSTSTGYDAGEIEVYSALIRAIISEVEAMKYAISHEPRKRIRDGVIEIYSEQLHCYSKIWPPENLISAYTLLYEMQRKQYYFGSREAPGTFGPRRRASRPGNEVKYPCNDVIPVAHSRAPRYFGPTAIQSQQKIIRSHGQNAPLFRPQIMMSSGRLPAGPGKYSNCTSESFQQEEDEEGRRQKRGGLRTPSSSNPLTQPILHWSSLDCADFASSPPLYNPTNDAHRTTESPSIHTLQSAPSQPNCSIQAHTSSHGEPDLPLPVGHAFQSYAEPSVQAPASFYSQLKSPFPARQPAVSEPDVNYSFSGGHANSFSPSQYAVHRSTPQHPENTHNMAKVAFEREAEERQDTPVSSKTGTLGQSQRQQADGLRSQEAGNIPVPTTTYQVYTMQAPMMQQPSMPQQQHTEGRKSQAQIQTRMQLGSYSSPPSTEYNHRFNPYSSEGNLPPSAYDTDSNRGISFQPSDRLSDIDWQIHANGEKSYTRDGFFDSRDEEEQEIDTLIREWTTLHVEEIHGKGWF